MLHVIPVRIIVLCLNTLKCAPVDSNFTPVERESLSKHSPWWTCPDNIMKTSFVFVFRRRLQEVFKTSSSRRTYSPNLYNFRRRLQDHFQMPWSRPIIVFVIRPQAIYRRFQDVFNTSLSHLDKTSSKRFQDVFKTSCKNIFKTLPRRIRIQDIFKTSSGRLEKISSRRFQNESSS